MSNYPGGPPSLLPSHAPKAWVGSPPFVPITNKLSDLETSLCSLFTTFVTVVAMGWGSTFSSPCGMATG